MPQLVGTEECLTAGTVLNGPSTPSQASLPKTGGREATLQTRQINDKQLNSDWFYATFILNFCMSSGGQGSGVSL